MRDLSDARFSLTFIDEEVVIKTQHFPYGGRARQQAAVFSLDVILAFIKNILLEKKPLNTPSIPGDYLFIIPELLSITFLSKNEAFERKKLLCEATEQEKVVLKKLTQRAINRLPQAEVNARESIKTEQRDGLTALKAQRKTIMLAQECTNVMKAYGKTQQNAFSLFLDEIAAREEVARVNIYNDFIGDSNNPDHFAFQHKLFQARTEKLQKTSPLHFNFHLYKYVNRCQHLLVNSRAQIAESIEVIVHSNVMSHDVFKIVIAQPMYLLLNTIQKFTNTEGIELRAAFLNAYLVHIQAQLDTVKTIEIKFHSEEQEKTIQSALLRLTDFIAQLKALSQDDCPVFGTKIKNTDFFDYINTIFDIYCFIQVSEKEYPTIAWTNITKSFQDKCNSLFNYLSCFIMLNPTMEKIAIIEENVVQVYETVQKLMAGIEVDWFTLATFLAMEKKIANNTVLKEDLHRYGAPLYETASFILLRNPEEVPVRKARR